MKTKNTKLFIETPPEPVEVKLHKATRERRSKAIWSFLETRANIKVSQIAIAAGYSPQNFTKYKKDKKTLPQHLLLKVELALKPYGLNV